MKLLLLYIFIATLLTIASSMRRSRGFNDEDPAMQESRNGSISVGGKYLRVITSHESRRKQREVLQTVGEAKVVTQRKFLRRDWCKSRSVRQQIRTTDGCRGRIINKFCYGQCNSFYIPNDVVIEPGSDVIRSKDVRRGYFRSCAFCMPSEEELVTVKLRCKGRSGRRVIRRQMARTRSCSCISVPQFNLPDNPFEVSTQTPTYTSTAAH